MSTYNEDSISHLSGLKHIQFRKSQYGFTPFGKDGILLMCKEILDNAIDEAGLDLKKQHEITIHFLKLKNTFQMILSDTGRGIPLNMLTKVLTLENTSGKWKDAYESSAGTNGVGAKGVAALSSYFAAVTYREEGMAHLTMQNASIVRQKVDPSKGVGKTGTTIFFEPDPSHMPNAATFFDTNGGYTDFLELVEFASVSLPNTKFKIHTNTGHIDQEFIHISCPYKLYKVLHETGAHITKFGKDGNVIEGQSYLGFMLGVKEPESLINWNSGVIERNKVKVPVTVQSGLNCKQYALMGYRVQFITTTSDYLQGVKFLSSINLIKMKSKSASQLTVLIDCIKTKLLGLVDKKYQEYFQDTYQLPIHLMVLATFQHATYQNQDKSNFVDDDFAKGFYTDLMEQLGNIPNEQWMVLYQIILPDLETKWNRKHRRDLKLNSDSKNLAFGLNKPNCYFECRDTGPGTELIICEGVSSGDWVKQHRDEKTQAVFELTGKILNSFSKGDGSIHVLQQNKVISDMIQVLNTSPEDNDLSSLRFEKIGILADSDPDGCHITALVLGCLYHINPQLFVEKRVFILNPPLFIINLKGTSEPIFIRDRTALNRFRSSYYSTMIDMVPVQNLKRLKPVVGEEFHAVVTMIRHVAGRITETAINRGLDSGLLEMLVHCSNDIIDKNSSAICKKTGYDQCVFDTTRGTMILYKDGLETVVLLQGLVETINRELVKIFKTFRVFDVYYEITSKVNSSIVNVPQNIIGMNNVFEQLDTGFKMRRMKGIGEMDASHLIKTCLDRETRSCTYVSDDSQLDKIKELMGIDSLARKELVLEQMEIT